METAAVQRRTLGVLFATQIIGGVGVRDRRIGRRAARRGHRGRWPLRRRAERQRGRLRAVRGARHRDRVPPGPPAQSRGRLPRRGPRRADRLPGRVAPVRAAPLPRLLPLRRIHGGDLPGPLRRRRSRPRRAARPASLAHRLGHDPRRRHRPEPRSGRGHGGGALRRAHDRGSVLLLRAAVRASPRCCSSSCSGPTLRSSPER